MASQTEAKSDEDYKVNKRPKDDTSDDDIDNLQLKEDYKAIRFIITSLWKRSGDAEGNPMHKAQTREKIDSSQQPIEVIPIEGITCSFDVK